ncbi:transketolase C-terminal domain-containing protein [Trebonia sp.]|uniref:transketolase family protein n=1 Tax=Trebonia sp. TaxID=2767075 RepID=UPI00262C0BEC|nr:transketolase C-terminal domain-containing protein [Trebonia sp.]
MAERKPAGRLVSANRQDERQQVKMVDVFSDIDRDTALKANPSGYAITELAAEDERIVTLTADLSNVLAEFRTAFPERYIELGIAETNSVSLAAGMAACGFVPYIYSMAPFGVLKCAEQLRTDADYNHLPVRLVGRLSGLAMGYFGTSHYAVEDIAIARMMANTTVVAPADPNAVLSLMRATADLPGPVYIRIAEATGPVYDEVPEFSYGQWPRLREGTDVTLAGHGMGVGLAVRAAEVLHDQHGVSADVYDAAYLKPYDEAAIVASASRTGKVLTIEDHIEIGGLGSIVAETVARHKLAVDLKQAALPDKDLEVGVPAELYEYYGLTVAGVVARALELVPAGLRL